MRIEYYKNYSNILNQDMEMKTYGHGGQPVLFIPCQDGRFFDFENFKMVDTYAPFIEAGQCTVFAIDTIDLWTWSDKAGDPGHRSYLYEQWIQYIVQEVVPFICQYSAENGWDAEESGIMVYGASMGATHSVNLYFRFPHIFRKMLAISGIYTADFGWDGYMDERLYYNSPSHYLANLPADHPYMAEYHRNHGIMVTGRGAWEMPEYTDDIKAKTEAIGIPVQYEYWGYDVNHDWPWWYKMVELYLPTLL